MRFWIQYHNLDSLQYLPAGLDYDGSDLRAMNTSGFDASCITTGKASIQQTGGDIIFLIVGYGNRPKQYVLWSWMKPNGEFAPSDDGRIDAFGSGEVLNEPAELIGEDYDEFKHRIANYSLGFREITTDPFLPTLVALAAKFGNLPAHP